jgi:hypothetical protein
MSLAERFADALAAEPTPQAVPELLPQRLARAVAKVLPADGAGISLRIEPDRQSPLGASDRDSGLAERLQFTIGAGPCLQASRTRQPVFVVEEDIQRRWPAFHDLLRVRTPFRGIVALPMRRGLEGAGAIDLYFRQPDGVSGLDVFAAMSVGDLVTDSLAEAALWSSWSEDEGPGWLHSPAAEHRARVWQAMALIGVALELEADEALAVLRAQAYAHGRTVDDLADDLVSGRADPAELSGGGDPGPAASTPRG